MNSNLHFLPVKSRTRDEYCGSVFLKLHGLFLFHSCLLNLLRLCATFITLKSSKMSSIMETKRVKTSLEDSPKSWINLNIMSRSPPHSPSENRRRVHTCSLSPKYNYICKGKNGLNFNEQKYSFFSIFFFNLFGFSLGLFSVSLTNPRIMTQAGVSGKSLTFKSDPEFLC